MGPGPAKHGDIWTHHPVFAKMVMEHDLREITANPDEKIDEDQGVLIENIVE